MNFRLISVEEKARIAPELVSDNSSFFVFDGNKYWIIRYRDDIRQQKFDHKVDCNDKPVIFHCLLINLLVFALFWKSQIKIRIF